MSKNKILSGAALLVFATISWGAVFPVAKVALYTVDGFYLTAFRYDTAAILFAPILWATEGLRAFRTEDRTVQLWFLGSMGFAGFNILVFLGLSHSQPEHGAIIVALMPLIAAALSWLTKGIKPNGVTLACIGVALAGVILVVTKGDPAVFHGDALLPDFMMFLGTVCWAVYTLGAGNFSGWSSLRYTSVSCMLGAVTILLLTMIATASGASATPPLDTVLSLKWEIVYLALIGGLMAALGWNAGIKIIGPVNGVLFINLVPVTAFAIEVMQGRRFGFIEVAGAALTIVALVTNNIYNRHLSRAAP